MKYTIKHIMRGLWSVKNERGEVVSYTTNKADAHKMRRMIYTSIILANRA